MRSTWRGRPPPPDSRRSCCSWEARRDANGQIYYANHTTRMTQWERPIPAPRPVSVMPHSTITPGGGSAVPAASQAGEYGWRDGGRGEGGDRGERACGVCTPISLANPRRFSVTGGGGMPNLARRLLLLRCLLLFLPAAHHARNDVQRTRTQPIQRWRRAGASSVGGRASARRRATSSGLGDAPHSAKRSLLCGPQPPAVAVGGPAHRVSVASLLTRERTSEAVESRCRR